MRKKIILIFGCFYNYDIAENTLQILGKSYELSEVSGAEIYLFGVTDDRSKAEKYEFGEYGVKSCRILVSSNDNIQEIITYTKRYIDELDPELLMFTADSIGKAVSANISSGCGFGLTADCIDISYENNGYIFTRTAMNDSVLADIVCINCDANMGTFKKGVFTEKKVTGKFNKVVPEVIEGSPDPCVIDIIEILEEVSTSNSIAGAKILFGIGRGVSNESVRNKIFEIAEKLNIGVVVTRAAVEAYGYPREIQIGQSGVSVTPQIYVAFGISGACQHMVGLRNVPLMIAVNTDKDASIFSYAHYRVVSDADEIVEYIYNKIIGGKK